MPDLASPAAPIDPLPALMWEMECASHLCARPFGFVSPGATELLGHGGEAWLHTPGFWRSLVHPDDAVRLASELDAFDAGQPFQGEFRLCHADGEYRQVFCQGAPGPSRAGQPRSYFGTCIDLSAGRYSRAEYDDLREAAQAAMRTRDQFLSALSHELRNPLNAIMGWAHLLQGGELTPDQTANGLAALVRSAEEQARLIAELMDSSRVLSGRVRLDAHLLDLEPVVDTVLAKLVPELEAKNLRVDSSYALVDRVVGDPDRLQQLVKNLVSNAIKFSPVGGTIRIAVGESGGHVEITVSDAGQGIASEAMPGLFADSQPRDSGAPRGRHGLGLGLELVRRIAELHGGSVSAASGGPGTGATFTVRLPVAGSSAIEEELAAEDEELIAQPSPTSLAGVRVLVAEDDAASRDLILKILDAAGARVVAVASAREALELVTRYLPHVLVSDIAMEDQDGYELLRQVRAFPVSAGGATPAIALTAFAGEEDREAALASGFDRHLGKPVSPARLVSLVAEMAASGP